MTNIDKMRIAVEKIIEFGLDGTGWTAESLREEAVDTAQIGVDWRSTSGQCAGIVVVVGEIGAAIRVEAEEVYGSPDDAIAFADLLRRVALLAAKIEVAMSNAEFFAAHPEYAAACDAFNSRVEAWHRENPDGLAPNWLESECPKAVDYDREVRR